MRLIRRTVLSICMVAGLAGVSACTGERPWMMEESSITPKPIALVESRYVSKKPLANFGDADVLAAAKAYGRFGAGPLYVVVAHPETESKGALDDRTDKIAAKLVQQGVDPKDIVASTVPLTTDAPVALVAFDTLEAQKPEGCTRDIPGYHDLPGKPADFDYTLGCSVREYMAKQIQNPRELKGVAGLGGTNDGDRAANIVNSTIKAGTPRAFLPSYVISALAGSGGE